MKILKRLLYGLLFMAIIPAILVAWANQTSFWISIPIPVSPIAGWCLFGIGFSLIVVAMSQMWIQGKGLPMNAFPPEKWVSTGLYGIFKHPIYIGAVLSSFGLSAASTSESGFWLVSPVFCLICTAYVLGFESEMTFNHFGPQKGRYLFSLPENNLKRAFIANRCRIAAITFLPWILVYETFVFIGEPLDAIVSDIFLDSRIPVLEETVILYSATYMFILGVPFLLNTNALLRKFTLIVWIASFLGFACFLFFPLTVPEFTISSTDFFSKWLAYEKSKDSTSASFPAFHVIWAILGGYFLGLRFKAAKSFFWVLTICISISCLTTKMHTVLDVILAITIAVLSIRYTQVASQIKFKVEAIANSWKEWRFGPVRVINHGLYGGLAAFAGVAGISGTLDSSYSGIAAFILGLTAILGALIWAQIVEGSPLLSRPYGYYGSIPGVLSGALIANLFYGIPIWELLAACCLAAPWVQIIGRFRCLVQGCCHGKPCCEEIGIRFFQPTSRVNMVSGLSGRFLHQTQMYSMVSNLFVGLFLMRLVSLSVQASQIVGMYLILSSLARFVEEGFRGEAQTKHWNGLSFYQWLAILCMSGGIGLTCIQHSNILQFHWEPFHIVWSFIAGISAFIMYGVDFPASGKPYARLSG